MLKRFALALCLGMIVPLSGCVSTATEVVAVSPNCQILEDPYFGYVPSIDKNLDPRGYFDEVVGEQSTFVAKLSALNPVDDGERPLLAAMVTLNKELLTIYEDEQQKRTAGQTARQFWDGMTPAERSDWQNAGVRAKAKTSEALEAWSAYAEYCGAENG